MHELLGLCTTAAKLAVTAARAPAARRRLRRVLASSEPPYKVHVGAGRTELAGWVNTDATWRASLFLDAAERWPFDDGTVSHIYADNVIEHLPLEGGRAMLCEAHRVLRPGGRLRLVTPDAERVTRYYLDPSQPFEEFARHQRQQGIDVGYRADMLRVTFAEHGHWQGFVYDGHSLTEEMAAAGFSVKEWDVGESDDPVLQGLERRRSTWARATQIVLEGTR